jgi:ectoine hydroxylase-related dioxygenase (phytanoyl-CoA dioxygenase family)
VYVGDTMWHADMGWDPKIPLGRQDPLRAEAAAGTAQDNAHLHLFPSLKVAFYLDPVTAESGALRVVPGCGKYDSK